MLIFSLSFNNSCSSSAGLGGGVGEGELGVKEFGTSGEEVYDFFLAGIIEVDDRVKFSLIILRSNFLDRSVKSFIELK
jgi:hypothetical protein